LHKPMHSISLTRALLLLGAILAGPALAACPGECPIPGGGSRRTDCLVEFDGVEPARSGGTAVRCTDGDPACDTDGVANGTCRFRGAACVHNADPRLPKCTPSDLASFTVRGGRRSPAALA